jgi:hypothetical protein
MEKFTFLLAGKPLFEAGRFQILFNALLLIRICIGRVLALEFICKSHHAKIALHVQLRYIEVHQFEAQQYRWMSPDMIQMLRNFNPSVIIGFKFQLLPRKGGF